MDFNRLSDEAVMSMHDNADSVFGKWKRQVNKLCQSHFGLTADDLPDACWADYHHDEMSPSDAIDCALIDAWDDIPELQTLWYGE